VTETSSTSPVDPKSLEREALTALFFDDLDRLDRVAHELGDVRYFELLTAATAAVVFKLWPQDPDPGDVPVFAQRISGYVSGNVSPAVIEAVIRSSLGEHDLIKDIPARDLLPAYFLIVRTGLHTALVEEGDRRSAIAEVADAFENRD
jgi:hypothetical protein